MGDRVCDVVEETQPTGIRRQRRRRGALVSPSLSAKGQVFGSNLGVSFILRGKKSGEQQLA